MKTPYLGLLLFVYSGLNAQNWQVKKDAPVDMTFPVVVSLNGNLHMMGGGANGKATDLHLRYSPSNNKWDTLAPVPFLAQQPAGAAINGKIYFCGGGYPNSGSRLDKHYYYDSDSMKWFAAAKMPVATAIHKAIDFNGKMYVLSGQPDKTLFEQYDPKLNKWTQLGALPDQNFWYSGLASTSKSIYRFGGGGFNGATSAAHEYDSLNKSWVSIPNLPYPLHAPAAIALNDSLIFITGGYYNGTTFNKTYIYNTNKRKYYPSDTMLVGRNYHALAFLNGCVYSVGGDNPAVLNLGTSLISICNPHYQWALNIKEASTQKPFSITCSEDYIYLKFETETLAEITLYNLKGEILQVGYNEIYTGGINSGVYFAIVKTEGKTYIEKVLIFK